MPKKHTMKFVNIEADRNGNVTVEGLRVWTLKSWWKELPFRLHTHPLDFPGLSVVFPTRPFSGHSFLAYLYHGSSILRSPPMPIGLGIDGHDSILYLVFSQRARSSCSQVQLCSTHCMPQICPNVPTCSLQQYFWFPHVLLLSLVFSSASCCNRQISRSSRYQGMYYSFQLTCRTQRPVGCFQRDGRPMHE